MTNPADNLLHWLRDAHSMEKQAIESVENQQKRLENYPEMRAWAQGHVRTAHQHRDLIRACIERRGGNTSQLKDLAMSVMGTIQEITGSFAEDEILKNIIADYAFKHYQIACYKSLIAAAEEAGDAETQGVCEGILATQQQQADALLPLIPQVTCVFLRRDAAEMQSKR